MPDLWLHELHLRASVGRWLLSWAQCPSETGVRAERAGLAVLGQGCGKPSHFPAALINPRAALVLCGRCGRATAVRLCSHLLSSPPAPGVEPFQPEPRAAIHGAPGCSESHRLVSTPARPPRLRRRHRRPLHPLLEHADRAAPAVHRHRLPGVQPGLVEARQRVGESSVPP